MQFPTQAPYIRRGQRPLTDGERLIDTFLLRKLLGRKLHPLIVLAATALVYLALCAPPASAIMASPQNIFRQASASEILSVKEVKKLQHLNQTHPLKVSISNFALEDAHYTFVRFCDSGTLDYCPTAFFMNSISDESFYGTGFFPALASLGDRIDRLCEACGDIRTLVFYGPNDSSRSIGLSARGIYF